MNTLIYYLFCLTVLLYTCNAYKALVVSPMPSRSHAILGDGVVKQLLKDGNEVVYLRFHEYKNAPSTLRQIDVSNSTDHRLAADVNIQTLLDKKIDFFDRSLIKQLMIDFAVRTLENEDVQNLLKDPKEHFDVVIVEWMFSDILSSLAAVYDCPLIWLCPMEVNSDILSLIDAAPNPAYSGDSLSLNIVPFTFLERVEELWTRLRVAYYNYMYYDVMQVEVYNTHIAPHIVKRGRQPPPYEKVKYNASIVIGNSHVSTGEAARLPQNYKPIGGYFIDDNVKPLPEDLKQIMESAKNGVIYFSMGSVLKSKDWPVEIKQSLLKMFGELKQTVLWKFEEDLPNVPKNVHILKWAPQPSILSHPNCLIFISHGGLLSTTETVHYGVPIIGIPVFGDQFVNVKRATSKGFALKVDLTYDVATDLKVAINEMLTNPKYMKRVKELSYVAHDRPLKPAQELVHWVRHVVHTGGASHLRSPALDVPLYQRLYLDLFIIVAIVLITLSALLKYVYCVAFSKTKSKNKKE